MTSPPRKHIDRDPLLPPVRSKATRLIHELAHELLHVENGHLNETMHLRQKIGNLDREVERVRSQVEPPGKYYEQMIEGMTEDSKRQQDRIKLLMETEDTLCMEANDIAANVCRLASAAIYHINDMTDEPGALSAVALLKPLAGGMHETRPWHQSAMSSYILDNEIYDDDPWNEWGTHKPLPIDVVDDMGRVQSYDDWQKDRGKSAESMMMDEYQRNPPVGSVERPTLFSRLDDPKPLPGEQGKSFVFNESRFNGDDGLTCGLRYLVMDGDAFDGLTFYGPFDDVDAAIKWGEDNCTVNEWRTCPVNEVEKD